MKQTYRQNQIKKIHPVSSNCLSHLNQPNKNKQLPKTKTKVWNFELLKSNPQSIFLKPTQNNKRSKAFMSGTFQSSREEVWVDLGILGSNLDKDEGMGYGGVF